MPGPHGVPRSEIIALLTEGYSGREIARLLHASPKRVYRIRNEAEPPITPAPALTPEQQWAVHARPVTGGHMRWDGALRNKMPNLVHRHRNYSARRIAFRLGHGRDPVGRVLPGCGQPWCVAPAHATDEPMRRADRLHAGIFGRVS